MTLITDIINNQKETFKQQIDNHSNNIIQQPTIHTWPLQTTQIPILTLSLPKHQAFGIIPLKHI